MEVTASHKYLRIAPRKVRLVADVVRGMDYLRALVELDHTPKRSGHHIAKLIESAASNALVNNNLVKDNLYIKEIRVDDGPTLKRYKPKGFGSAMPIAKRTSHITIILDERVPGLKASATAEAKADKQDDKKPVTAQPEVDPDGADASLSEAASDGTTATQKKATKELGKKQDKGKGFFKKMFQRQKNV